MQCLDDNVATEFVSGTLSKPQSAKVEGHLAGCRDCRALVAALASDGADDSDLATSPLAKVHGSSPSQAGQLPALVIGDRVGRYLVLSRLGAGGMGVVFSAYDPQLDRKVALKVLRAGLGKTSDEARTRLRREAQAIAQLSHPNVVAVYDVGTIAESNNGTNTGDIYIAMEFIEGDTLGAWLKRWPRSWREIVEVFAQAGRGLLAAHSVGLLHRDFKPDNVLVGGDNRVRVSDFGLARSFIEPPTKAELKSSGELRALSSDAMAALTALTATGTVLGTPRYMPPEQLVGPDIDARSDQFSFCVALYEALYGAHPLPGGTAVSMIDNNDRALPPPDSSKVPAAIASGVARGLERDRAKRFPSMQALLAELVRAPQRSPVWMVAGVLAAVLVVGGATAAVVSHNTRPEIQPPTDAVQVLITQINAKEQERRQLLAELEAVKGKDRVEIDELRAKLGEKDVEIQGLVTKVSNIEHAAKVRPVPRLPPSQSAQVTAAVSEAEHDLEGCFTEWSGRHPDLDAELLVRVAVLPTGLTHSSVAKGVDESMLPECVSGAIARVHYPTGREQLDLEVGIGWSQGVMNLSPRVVGHHEAPRVIFDIE